MCLQTSSRYLKKGGLWPRQSPCAQKKTKKMKTCRSPPKPEGRSLSSRYRWIELGAHNFSPETVPLHHFRFLHYSKKQSILLEIGTADKINKLCDFGKTECGALIRCSLVWSMIGYAIIAFTVMRGFNEAYGSWKIILGFAPDGE